MTDRGLPSADGSPACPFVALEDDRDARADRPDHRHRCFAEAQPAPRALAHQEAYCLSSAFPVCPTFQDWARREAAHAVPGAEGHDGEAAAVAASAAAGAGAGDDPAADGDDEDLWVRPPEDLPIEERPRRNPPRDWAAPPPWASSAAAGAAAGAAASGGTPRGGTPSQSDVPEEAQGLAGSAADRLARGEDLDAAWTARPPDRPVWTPTDTPSSPADPDLAGLVGKAARQAEASESHGEVRPPPTKAGRRPTVSSTRDRNRERERAAAAAAASDHDGPSWEKSRRYEAYPSIKTRAGLSGISGVPTIAILAGGVVLAAVILFFLPGVLGVGRDGGSGAAPSASPSPSAEESASASPTPIPEPTPTVYTIKTGDTLSKIARKFNVSLDALLAANKDTIKNPNRIRVGDEIVIPLPETEQVPSEGSASPSA
ncbi:MAG TPA: LysM domain-containing protein [Candidatus Limnocylindrales bacterium]|nr:LysM domain-containing protein [Candidatus Limnocylindrales bacterium]